MKKVIVWMCAVVCVVMACVVPCWADTWEEETPDYGIPFGGPTAWTTGTNNTEKVIQIVKKATELGMFGGANPVYIYYMYSSTNDWFRIMVAVPATTAEGWWGGIGTEATAKRGAYRMHTINVNYQFMTRTGGSVVAVPWVMYVLQFNGDWGVTKSMGSASSVVTSNTPVGQQTSVIYKRVAEWSADANDWVTPSTTQTSADIVGWGAVTSTIPGLQAIIDKYDEQIELLTSEPIVVPPATYELDIASIFDGMFNGIHNIFEGFDIELFGISIVGVLVACLVIAIVTFIVKRLWK